jgi:prophage maintenance system killer protein
MQKIRKRGDFMPNEKNEIILFENQGVKLEVNLKDETVWLNRKQLSKLFERDIKTIGKHINNALKEELAYDNSVVAKFATTASDGKNYQVEYYNLDMILSVGYRVKSNKGIIFRRWANKVLKEYTLKGYAINQKRLEYLEKTIKLIDIANRIDERLENNDAREILKVIGEYSKALDLLDDYDHKTLKKIDGKVDTRKINYDECINIINKLRFNEESNLFAIERDEGLKSIIGNIYQSFDNQEIYKSIEEKAANFLYLIVKNHVFVDGNKRIAATLFIYFLNFYGILYKESRQVIDNNTLTALTLLIAESNPKEKDVIIDLVMNFLND